MVTVFGLGFVGLTTALGFAHLGYTVYGIDVDLQRKDKLSRGEVPFLEPDMEEVLKKQLSRNFFVTDNVKTAIAESDYVFYCVGTPYGKDGSADLTYLFQAIDMTFHAIEDDKHRALVIKSTIPPSTTAEKVVPYVQEKGMKNISVCNNPEFLREGYCWQDFMEADRIVIGCNDKQGEEMLTGLYSPMNIPIKCVSHTTGEFIKYLSNTLLATLISYSNEMAAVADAIGGIDVAEAFRILHMDKRWNGCDMTGYVYPGCGYGGYCLPKDTNALLAQSKEKGFEPAILKKVIEMNDSMAEMIARKIMSKVKYSGAVTIGILGLSFKPGSDDVRDTPAAKIMKALKAEGDVNLAAYDPAACKEFQRAYPELNIRICGSAIEVYETSDVIAITTAWEEFRKYKSLEGKPVVDCRYMA